MGIENCVADHVSVFLLISRKFWDKILADINQLIYMYMCLCICV